MIDELTEAFEKSEADIKEAFHGIIRKLNSDYSLKAMPVVYRETIKQIEKLRKKLKDGQQKNIEGLDRLKEALEGAAESADKLVKRYVDLINRICRIADETEFVHLYDKKKQLFPLDTILKKTVLQFLL